MHYFERTARNLIRTTQWQGESTVERLTLEEADKRKRVEDLQRKILINEEELKSKIFEKKTVFQVPKGQIEDITPPVSLIFLMLCEQSSGFQGLGFFLGGTGAGSLLAWSDVKKARAQLDVDKKQLFIDRQQLQRERLEFETEKLRFEFQLKNEEHSKITGQLKGLSEDRKNFYDLRRDCFLNEL